MTEKELAKSIEELQQTIDMYHMLSDAGLLEKVSFVSRGYVYLVEDVDLLKTREELREFFDVEKDPMLSCYLSQDGATAVPYSYGQWKAVFYFTEAPPELCGGER